MHAVIAQEIDVGVAKTIAAIKLARVAENHQMISVKADCSRMEGETLQEVAESSSGSNGESPANAHTLSGMLRYSMHVYMTYALATVFLATA